MHKFNVGDKVILTKVENGFGEDHSAGYNLPMVVQIRDIEEGTYDYGLETLDGQWLTSAFERYLQPFVHETKVQRLIEVREGKQSVKYMTDTKRDRVSILRTGTAIGHIKFEEIDTYIALLLELKEEV